MSAKDYYRILGIDQGASEAEIKQAYRKLALQFHPDRNPGNPRAEERFKAVSEAYGVLIDPDKRRQYNAQGATFTRQYQDRQEDIFRDMFRNPQARDLFDELRREFEKHGVPFDQKFVNRVFFGGRGIFFGGIFFAGPIFGGSVLSRGFRSPSPAGGKPAGPKRREVKTSELQGGLFSRIGRKIGTLLPGHPSTPIPSQKPLDMEYHLTLTRSEAASGSKIRLAYKRGETHEKLDVIIPPGTGSGSRLRLRGKGTPNPSGGQPGDLYLHIKVSD